MCGSDVFLGIIAILFPPLAVWVKRGICGADSLINIALCCLGFIPGLLHAWYIIAKYPDPTYEQLRQDPERGNVRYYYVQNHSSQPQSSGQTYGTVRNTPNAQFPVHSEGFVRPPTHAPQGSSQETPPTYQQAVGDNKIQKP